MFVDVKLRRMTVSKGVSKGLEQAVHGFFVLGLVLQQLSMMNPDVDDHSWTCHCYCDNFGLFGPILGLVIATMHVSCLQKHFETFKNEIKLPEVEKDDEGLND